MTGSKGQGNQSTSGNNKSQGGQGSGQPKAQGANQGGTNQGGNQPKKAANSPQEKPTNNSHPEESKQAQNKPKGEGSKPAPAKKEGENANQGSSSTEKALNNVNAVNSNANANSHTNVSASENPTGNVQNSTSNPNVNSHPDSQSASSHTQNSTNAKSGIKNPQGQSQGQGQSQKQNQPQKQQSQNQSQNQNHSQSSKPQTQTQQPQQPQTQAQSESRPQSQPQPQPQKSQPQPQSQPQQPQQPQQSEQTQTRPQKASSPPPASITTTSAAPAPTISNSVSDDALERQGSSEAILPQLVTHPLEKQWTFWTNSQTDTNFDNYDEKIQPFGEVATIEDFWGCFNNMQPPSKLGTGKNLQLFKKGIKPLWEDQQNLDGGEWRFNFQYAQNLDKAWLNLLLVLIGQTLEFDDEICGASLIRKGKFDRIELWLRVSRDSHKKLTDEIRDAVVKVFPHYGEAKNDKIEYKDHKETVQQEYSNAHRKR